VSVSRAGATSEHRALDSRKDTASCERQLSGTIVLEAMAADQQADLFRELPEEDRARLLRKLERARCYEAD
jgi:hypothetical protein